MDGEDRMDLLVSQLGALSETTRRQLGGAADSLLCIKKADASYKRYEN